MIDTFVPSDIVMGSGGDTGIDAIAIIVNNVLVTDVDMVAELAAQNWIYRRHFHLCAGGAHVRF